MGSRCLPSSPALRAGRGRSGRAEVWLSRRGLDSSITTAGRGGVWPTWRVAGVEVVDRLEVGHRRADVAATGDAGGDVPQGLVGLDRDDPGRLGLVVGQRAGGGHEGEAENRGQARRRTRPGARAGSGAACSAAAGRSRRRPRHRRTPPRRSRGGRSGVVGSRLRSLRSRARPPRERGLDHRTRASTRVKTGACSSSATIRSTGRSARPTTEAPCPTVRRRGVALRVGAAGGVNRGARVATVLLI